MFFWTSLDLSLLVCSEHLRRKSKKEMLEELAVMDDEAFRMPLIRLNLRGLKRPSKGHSSEAEPFVQWLEEEKAALIARRPPWERRRRVQDPAPDKPPGQFTPGAWHFHASSQLFPPAFEVSPWCFHVFSMRFMLFPCSFRPLPPRTHAFLPSLSWSEKVAACREAERRASFRGRGQGTGVLGASKWPNRSPKGHLKR